MKEMMTRSILWGIVFTGGLKDGKEKKYALRKRRITSEIKYSDAY